MLKIINGKEYYEFANGRSYPVDLMKDALEKYTLQNLHEIFNLNIRESKEIWKTIEEISNIVNLDVELIKKSIDSNPKFVRNSKKEYTTVKLYESRSTLMKKIVDTLNGRIK